MVPKNIDFATNDLVDYYFPVSTVTEIIEAVKRLDERQKSEFLQKLAEVDLDDAWDRQIEADAKAGKLDRLWQEALEDIEAGRTKPLDEIIDHA